MSGGDSNPVLSPVKLPWKGKALRIGGVDKHFGDSRNNLAPLMGQVIRFSAVFQSVKPSDDGKPRRHCLVTDVIDADGSLLCDHGWVYLTQHEVADLSAGSRYEFIGKVHA